MNRVCARRRAYNTKHSTQHPSVSSIRRVRDRVVPAVPEMPVWRGRRGRGRAVLILRKSLRMAPTRGPVFYSSTEMDYTRLQTVQLRSEAQ